MKSTITFDPTKIIATDLTGEVIPVNVCHTIGNVVYIKATTLDWDAIARAIYAGNSVELTTDQANAMEALLLSPDTPIYLIIKKPIKDYFDSLRDTVLKAV